MKQNSREYRGVSKDAGTKIEVFAVAQDLITALYGDKCLKRKEPANEKEKRKNESVEDEEPTEAVTK